MRTRREFALRASIIGLMRKGYCTMWTWTTPDQCSVREIARRWNHFLTLWRKENGRRVTMVRVFEPHPGGHGWHVHGIVAGYWPVQIVRPLAKMAGFGRIHVQPARSGCEVYLAKYLRKVLDFVGRLKGTRVWATIGGKVGGVEEGWRCRVAGVQVDSPGSRAWRDWFKRRLGDGFMIPGNERSGFAEALFAAKHFWLGDGSWLSTAAPF